MTQTKQSAGIPEEHMGQKGMVSTFGKLPEHVFTEVEKRDAMIDALRNQMKIAVRELDGCSSSITRDFSMVKLVAKACRETIDLSSDYLSESYRLYQELFGIMVPLLNQLDRGHSLHKDDRMVALDIRLAIETYRKIKALNQR